MAEVFFVIKCFIFSAAIVFCLQFKYNNEPIEQKITMLLKDSSTHRWLSEVGFGAINFSRNMYSQALGRSPLPPLTPTSTYPEVEMRGVSSERVQNLVPAVKKITEKELQKYKDLEAASEGYESQNNQVSQEQNDSADTYE